MKKLFVFVLAGLATLSLASCGKKNNKTQVVFWHTMSATTLQPILDAAIEEFEEMYPDIEVTHSQIGGYDEVRDNIVTNMLTRTYPTMAYCYPDHVAIYNRGKITITLDELMEDEKIGFGGSELKFEGPTKETLVSTFYNEGQVYGDDKTYTLPFLKSTEALFYNKTFFAANGLEVPTTWDELWTLCARIKEIDKTSIPLGIDSEDNLFITLAEQYGNPYTTATGSTAADYFTFNNAGNKAFVTDFKQKYEAGYFMLRSLNGNKYNNTIFTNPAEASRMYMTIGSTGGANYQANANGAFETGVALIPQVSTSSPKSISQGPSIVLFKNTDQAVVDATWLFTQYLLTDQVQAQFAMASGYMPVTTTSIELPIYQNYLSSAAGNKDGITALTVKQALENLDSYFISPAFRGSTTARTEVGTIFYYVLKGDKDVNKAFDDAITECVYQAS